jgi:hypothetical protein
VADSFAVEAEGDHEWQLTPGQDAWCAFEIRNARGDLRLLTNPIYFE